MNTNNTNLDERLALGVEPDPVYDHFEPWMIGRLIEVEIVQRYRASAGSGYGYRSEYTTRSSKVGGRLLYYQHYDKAMRREAEFRLEEAPEVEHTVEIAPGDSTDKSVKLAVTVTPLLRDVKLQRQDLENRLLFRAGANTDYTVQASYPRNAVNSRRAERLRRMSRKAGK